MHKLDNANASKTAKTTKVGVSRAEEKLAGAVKAFGFDFRDKVVMDIGASTGGFTEFALKHGAKKVIAIEKGTNQMQAPLRYNPKIDLREKTDIFTIKAEDVDANIDIVVADVSFVSLVKVLIYVKNHIINSPIHSKTTLDTTAILPASLHTVDFLVMMKPQFEAQKHQLYKGVFKNNKFRRQTIKDFEANIKQAGFIIIKKRDNDFPGKKRKLGEILLAKN